MLRGSLATSHNLTNEHKPYLCHSHLAKASSSSLGRAGNSSRLRGARAPASGPTPTTATLVGAHTPPRHARCPPQPLPALLLPHFKGQTPNCPFVSRKHDRTNQDQWRIQIGATTRIKMTVCRKSGAAAHPADRTVPHQWLDGNRCSRLDRQLRHNGWMDLQPSDRTPVNGRLLGGSSNIMASPYIRPTIWSPVSNSG